MFRLINSKLIKSACNNFGPAGTQKTWSQEALNVHLANVHFDFLFRGVPLVGASNSSAL